MKWATRASIHIDRAASAWLIRRFIDAFAELVFVTDPVFDDLDDDDRRSLLGKGTPT
jgi:hypothetical protein